MRVIHLTNRLSGGVMTAIDNLVLATQSFSHHLIYVGKNEDDLESITNRDNFKSIIFIQEKNPLTVSRKLKNVILRLGIDLVHAHSSWAGTHQLHNRGTR